MEYLAVLLPSVAVGTIFYFVMRAIFNADRSEREAMTRAEERNGTVQPETAERPTKRDDAQGGQEK